MATPPFSLRRLDPRARDAHPFAGLLLSMLLAVLGVAALAFWDAERESGAALDDFAQEQATLAAAVAAEVSARLAALPRDTLAEVQPFEGAARIERPGAVRVLILGPRDAELRGTDGRAVDSEPIRRALAAGQSLVWLPRADSAAIGLPRRRAAVGLATIDAGALGRWGIAVASSAERERQREERARLRLVLGVLLAGGLVSVFGSLALRKQRRGLLLERELTLEALGRERDTELATASRAATMGTLAMGIAHEIGTPLGIISGRAEQLAPRVEGDPRAARSVQAILEQGERIRRVIQGFLGVVRGGAPALGDAAPAAVVEGAVALVEHRFRAAGVALASGAAGGLPAVHCDAPMLQQALVNLLLNACDACGRGGHVALQARAEGEHVAFTVTDDGPGIRAEDAARALEPFFTTKPAGKGTGIGLAIANEIVKLHRGTLALGEAAPRGTRATVTIPIPRVQAHAAR